MSQVNLDDVSVDIPLRGVAASPRSDPRIQQKPGRGLVVSALRGVTLEARPGDRVGIMGTNGAGKTTLLRVIAGIMPISAGRVTIDGDVHGIFNVSDGMRMALTGRENARLRYFLLGEPGNSVDAFVEDVRAFADLGDFFELPVNAYSPGMMSRLLFAMSTVRHADILLLDEWIGVSDRAFQEKAAERLRGLIDSNDIFFVATHNRSIMREITDRIIVLERGKVVRVNSPDEL